MKLLLHRRGAVLYGLRDEEQYAVQRDAHVEQERGEQVGGAGEQTHGGGRGGGGDDAKAEADVTAWAGGCLNLRGRMRRLMVLSAAPDAPFERSHSNAVEETSGACAFYTN
ncbi:hypothetical protein FGB62_259g016 [Gracilaria domingensis]|nr:hypothetical protein FGB62_259g016 [Gracilaria domingensis]